MSRHLRRKLILYAHYVILYDLTSELAESASGTDHHSLSEPEELDFSCLRSWPLELHLEIETNGWVKKGQIHSSSIISSSNLQIANQEAYCQWILQQHKLFSC
jgi:hypothetical protein